MSDSAAALRAECGIRSFIDSPVAHDVRLNYTFANTCNPAHADEHTHSVTHIRIQRYTVTEVYKTHRHEIRQAAEPTRQQDVFVCMTL